MVYPLQYNLWILLYGLDPELSGYEAELALCEREVGPKPEKGTPSFFFRTCSFEKMLKNIVNN